MTPCFPRLAAAVVLAIAARSASCAEAPATITRDARGCGVVNLNPKAGESITWSGACQDGLAEGSGLLQWRQGETLGASYSGRLSAGKQTGQGIETFTSGDRYEGNFVDGRRSGHGVFTWPGGLRYEGDFVDGQRSGHGSFDMGGGLRYDGAFERGDMSGQGTLTFLGARIEGTFVRGRLDGPAVLVRKEADGESRLPLDVGAVPAAAEAPASGAASAPVPTYPRIDVATKCRPQYPPMALRTQAMGRTDLALLVDPYGQVLRARLVHSSGSDFAHGLLDLSALLSLVGCPVETSRVPGQSAERWIKIAYQWRLE